MVFILDLSLVPCLGWVDICSCLPMQSVKQRGNYLDYITLSVDRTILWPRDPELYETEKTRWTLVMHSLLSGLTEDSLTGI